MIPGCICQFPTKQAWCDYRNAELDAQGKGLVWIVGTSGTVMLTDDEQASARRRKREAEAQEEERKRFNWRLMHPVTEGTGRAA
jgi:hypothetical protein